MLKKRPGATSWSDNWAAPSPVVGIKLSNVYILAACDNTLDEVHSVVLSFW